ncbi:MAG TPA: serine/threonine-protein kinase, partial [Kofleriaceae bacterium]
TLYGASSGRVPGEPERRAEAASPTAPTVPAAGEGDALVAIGACLGRYTVRSQLGSGGMGEVYAAHDPELDRLVAVKVVRAGIGSSSPEARMRFQREAQAMARLNHPNVVSVYDVGTIGGRTFVAMELVDGPTLAAWLAEPRDVREIVDVLAQAGRGLAAAHAAGLTHRDFKPSNVMLGERVRVVDFGLARPVEGDDSADSGATPLSATVTHSGGVVGTPAYMAPEQRTRAEWSALSDQYSFAVVLHEAVTGARPGESPAGPRALPAWLRPVLDRALQPRPEDRFPSMDALLARLERSRHRTRRRWIAASAGVAVVAVGASVAWRTGASDPCTGAEARMAGIWDEPRRAQVHAAFDATHLPFAQLTWDQVSAALDRYRQDWLASHVERCRATRVEGRQSDALLDLQMGCLERRRSLVHELTQVWIDGTDRRALARAGDAASSLPSIADCAQDKALLERAPLPGDPAAVARIGQIRTDLDRVRALWFAGRIDDARKQIAPVVDAADATGWVPVRAEARYLAGRTASSLSLPAAEPELIEANKLAADAHDDRLAAEARVDLVDHLAFDERSAERALLVAQLADAAVARAGNDPRQRSKLLRYRGDALEAAGKLADARQTFGEAHAFAVRAFGAGSYEALRNLTKLASIARTMGNNDEARKLGEDSLAGMSALVGTEHPSVVTILNEIGAAASNQDDYETAARYYGRALEISERIFGPDSLGTATMLNNTGEVEIRRGHLDEAQRRLERSLAIRERLLGKDHPQIALTLHSLGTVLEIRGDFDGEIAVMRRALAITTKASGPDDAANAIALEGIAEGLRCRGELTAALDHHQRALDLRKRVLGPVHPQTLNSMTQLANVLKDMHRCREANQWVAAALPGFEKAGADPSWGYEVRGECELAAREPARAAASAELAIAACEKTSPTSLECPSKYWLQARALDALGKRPEALAAARRAEQRAVAIGVSPRVDLKVLRAWIARRTRAAR